VSESPPETITPAGQLFFFLSGGARMGHVSA